MTIQEEQLLEQITKNRKVLEIDPGWLAKNYCISLSKELRCTIAERLGWQGPKGWMFLKQLIKEKGIQEELIYAAGLSYQSEAKEWLFAQLRIRPDYKLELLKALTCLSLIHI